VPDEASVDELRDLRDKVAQLKSVIEDKDETLKDKVAQLKSVIEDKDETLKDLERKLGLLSSQLSSLAFDVDELETRMKEAQG
jgi:predicted nuclease with TOPRIM domain